MQTNYWLLPDGIDEVLPQSARTLELLRRNLLDLFERWGYQLVMPPMVEYLDALLTGTGNDLDLQTFKLVDQHSGRMLGLRSDMTPQIARIDSHQLLCEEPSRLCYMGTVLRTRSDDFAARRNPMQFGVELFGHDGPQSDVEVITVMINALGLVGLNELSIDLGHVGIYRGLARLADLSAEQEHTLFDALQRKAVPEIESFVAGLDLNTPLAEALSGLAMLSGDAAVIKRAREMMAPLCDESISRSLNNLEQVYSLLKVRLPGLKVHFDLAELRGYAYQTGVVFAAFVPGCGSEVARGGRYDAIGECFGRARPATGFSADLKALVNLSEVLETDQVSRIFAPFVEDTVLREKIEALRLAGRRVIEQLPGQQGGPAEMGCDKVLIRQASKWIVADVESLTPAE